jgi:predicted GIY-YIG superfamily endonuclease
MTTYSMYIIYSKCLDAYYVGSTENISNRLLCHNNSSGSKYTKRTKDWVLVYSEDFVTRSDAQKREYAIKRKKSRKYIEWLVTHS